MDKPHGANYWTTRIRPKTGWFDIDLKVCGTTGIWSGCW